MILVSVNQIKILCNHVLEYNRALHRMFGMLFISMVKQVWGVKGSFVGQITCPRHAGAEAPESPHCLLTAQRQSCKCARGRLQTESYLPQTFSVALEAPATRYVHDESYILIEAVRYMEVRLMSQE